MNDQIARSVLGRFKSGLVELKGIKKSDISFFEYSLTAKLPIIKTKNRSNYVKIDFNITGTFDVTFKDIVNGRPSVIMSSHNNVAKDHVVSLVSRKTGLIAQEKREKGVQIGTQKIEIYAIPAGETDLDMERLISIRCLSQADVDNVKTVAGASGFHSFRVHQII